MYNFYGVQCMRLVIYFVITFTAFYIHPFIYPYIIELHTWQSIHESIIFALEIDPYRLLLFSLPTLPWTLLTDGN